jgi:DNA-binding response OmpR family regulator
MEKILVQDTDASLLDLLRIALEMENFEVHTVFDSGSDFLKLIDKIRPHVVLLDYKINGDLCREICKKIKVVHPNLPVIALSCNNNIHEIYDKHGFDAYIKKPFDLALLYKILRKYLPGAQPGFGNPTNYL